MTHLHGHFVGITLGLRLPRFYVIQTFFSWKMYTYKKVVLTVLLEGIF
jgi:hypothetical protein